MNFIQRLRFKRKLKSFFKTLCMITDGLRNQGMSTMEARNYIIKMIDDMLIMRANIIKNNRDKKK